MQFVRRRIASEGSIAQRVGMGENPAGLFREVVGPRSGVTPATPAPSRLSADSFVATSQAAGAKLARVLAGNGAFVSTGQQPGLFLGPLYTIYKLASAIDPAARLEEASGVPHLALFWVASDDHDWDEVATSSILAPDETLRRFALPPGSAGASVGEYPLPGEVSELAETLRSALGVESPILDELLAGYEPGVTVGRAFIRGLSHIFGASDVVFLDSSGPEIRLNAAELYSRVVGDPDAVLMATNEGAIAVEEAGFPVQLRPPDRGLQVFVDAGEGRDHLLSSPEGFETRAGASWSETEIRSLLQRHPAAFTPAAALRPVLESWLLPVSASVLGPAETAYWAQLSPLFVALGVTMPAVSLRDGWYLLEPRVERLLGKVGTDPDAVEFSYAALRESLVGAARPSTVDDALDELHSEVERRLGAVREAGSDELPGLAASVRATEKAVRTAIEGLRRAIDADAARRQETLLNQLERLRSNLVPGGDPQERAVGCIGFLARYGSDLVDQLVGRSRVAGTRGAD